MSRAGLPAIRTLRVALARMHRRLRVAGAVGCALILLAVVTLAIGWRDRQLTLEAISRAALDSQSSVPAPPPTALRAAPPRLPDATDVPKLLARIERAAMDSGLGWPRADYRVNAATGDTPANLEARCTVKGPYPAVRRFATTLLQDAPTLTFKEFALSRTSADASDLEAKITLVIYIAAKSDATGGPRP